MVAVGSAVSLALSVVAAKAYALLIGPDGLGLLALMQSIMIVGVMLASGGLATSAVRAIAAARHADEVVAIARSASLVGFVGGACGVLIVLALHEPLASLVLGAAERIPIVLLIAIALGIAVVGSVQIAILTGLHRVSDVVVVNVATSLVSAAVGIALVAALGVDGLAPAVLATAAVQLILSWLFAARALTDRAPHLRAQASLRRVRGLLATGMPVATGQLAGSGAMFLMPIVVLQVLETTDVGYYRAAAAISIGYLTFFLAALTQDFYPRLARAGGQEELAGLVLRRMRLLMGMGLPVILGLLAGAPLLVELLYSTEFGPSRTVLEWHLVGDLIRLPAWVLVFVLLARGGAWIYAAAELVGGVGLLAATWVGLIVLGLAGSGVGYAAAQTVYYVVALLLARRYVGATAGRLQVVVMLTAVSAALLLVVPIEQVAKSLLFAAGAVLFAAAAWPRLYRLHRAGEL